MKLTFEQKVQVPDMQQFPSSTVAVVGLGKVGLPLAVHYARRGRRVIGCDINVAVVDAINAGQSHIREEPELAEEVSYLVAQGLLSATQHTTEAVYQAGIVVVIVPVGINAHHEVSFELIDAATTAIGAGLKPGTLVIYETTLPVGTTSGRFRQLLERTSHMKAGQEFRLAYSPERVGSGSIFRNLRMHPKVVGGIDAASTAAAVAFYRSVLDAEIIIMDSAADAEFVKLIETTYRDVNIALANEFACFADRHGLDVATAIAAANTQPHAHIHAPGVGVGGHCIPVYPYFLFDDVDKLDLQTLLDTPLHMLMLPRYARHINDAMAEYAVQRLEAAMGTLAHKAVLILGVAYRGGVRETAFTSARLLQDALLSRGATVYVDDPLFTTAQLQAMDYVPLPEGQEINAIMLQADHAAYQAFDFGRFPHCQVVLDGRRALDRTQIESLGIRYLAIGDGDQQRWLAQ